MNSFVFSLRYAIGLVTGRITKDGQKFVDAKVIRLEARIAELRSDIIEKDATIIALNDDFNRIGNVVTDAFELIGGLKIELSTLRSKLLKYESVDTQ